MLQTATTATQTVRRHWRDGRGKIIVAVAVGWFLSIGIRRTYPVLLPYIQDTYGLTLSTVGLLLTVLWVAYALGQLPGGLIGDRIGEGIVLSASILLSGVMLTLVVFSESALVFFASTAALGLALAFFGTVRLSAVSDTYPEQRGTAIGFISAVGDIGNTVLPVVAGVIAAAVAWQLGFGITIPFFFLIGIAIWIVVPRRTDETRETTSSFSLQGARSVLADLWHPSIVLVLVLQTIGSAIYRAFTGFYPTYLINMKGMSPTVAAGLFALFFALGTVIKPVSGNAYDRFGARRTLFVLVGVSGGGFLVLPFVEHFWALVFITGVVGVMGGKATICLSYMTAALPDRILNTGLGTLRTVYMLIAALSPVVFGTIAEAGYFDEAFLLLALVSGLSLLFVFLLPKL